MSLKAGSRFGQANVDGVNLLTSVLRPIKTIQSINQSA